MADTNNPFEKLIVDDSQEANKEELANLIGPYVYFIRSNHAVEFKPEIRDLPNKLKILIVLASFKAKSYIFDTDEKIKRVEAKYENKLDA
ncbi:MAG: hypothetical protein NT039_02805, partial [Candidatus Berkelbacteria bacterium]|nr:hypothetical protein [Candidatus Berkelbacteria bacterium]